MTSAGSREIWKPWIEMAEVPSASLKDDGPWILDMLQEQLLMDTEWVHRSDRRLTWWGAPLPMTIDVSEPRLVMGDPTVKVTINLRLLDSIGTSPFERVCQLLLAINGVNFGGMMWVDPNTRTVNSTVTHYAHDGNRGIIENKVLSMLALFNYGSALGKAPHLEEMFETEAVAPPHPTTGYRYDYDELTNFPSVVAAEAHSNNNWQRLGVEESLVNFQRHGYMATGDRDTVTTEFPYTTTLPMMQQIAMGAPQGMTSLYIQSLKEAHPHIGGGLLCTLRVPEERSSEDAAVLTNGLNWSEANELTGFPAWGAWTVSNTDDHADLTHVLFSPGAMGQRGLAMTIGFHASTRARWAQERLLSPDQLAEVENEMLSALDGLSDAAGTEREVEQVALFEDDKPTPSRPSTPGLLPDPPKPCPQCGDDESVQYLFRGMPSRGPNPDEEDRIVFMGCTISFETDGDGNPISMDNWRCPTCDIAYP